MNKAPRISWSPEEDDDIRQSYAAANGAFPTYRQQARDLNRRHHQGKPIRTASSVRRREAVLLNPDWKDGRGKSQTSRTQLLKGHRSPKHQLTRKPHAESRKLAISKANKNNPRVIAACKLAAKATATRHPELLRRGDPNHMVAKMWFLKDPDNKRHQFSNLVGFVLGNPHLFLPGEAVMRKPGKSNSIKAVGGLSNIRPRDSKHKRPQSWKGWTWDHASEREFLSNNSHP